MLNLGALDRDDIEVLSAFVQDSLVQPADMAYMAGRRRFLIKLNRFCWERSPEFNGPTRKPWYFRIFSGFRRRTGAWRTFSLLQFDDVLSVQTLGIAVGKPDMLLSLLAIEISTDINAEKEPGSGDDNIVLTLRFSGGKAVRLKVEVIEARLKDIGRTWRAESRPDHGADSDLTSETG